MTLGGNHVREVSKYRDTKSGVLRDFKVIEVMSINTPIKFVQGVRRLKENVLKRMFYWLRTL